MASSAQHPLACPRCESINTKFCYYNNYNHSQPRHFCKACRRYWTHGGSLRNIPMGGLSRKHSKRSRINSVSAASTAIAASSSSTCSRQGKQTEEADWVLSGVNMNEMDYSSFSSLTGYGFGFGLNDEFGLGGVGGDFVHSVSEPVNVDPTSSEKWHDYSGRVDMSDCFGWADLSISVSGKDMVD